MIYRFIIFFLSLQFLLYSSPLRAEDKLSSANEKFSVENDRVMKDLSSIKNPFLSPPLPPPKVEPSPAVPAPVKKKSKKHKEPKKAEEAPPEPINLSTLHLTLDGIVWGHIPQAIINGKVVGVGDTIEESKVLSIAQKGVELFYKDVKILLTIDQGIKPEGSLLQQKEKNPNI